MAHWRAHFTDIESPDTDPNITGRSRRLNAIAACLLYIMVINLYKKNKYLMRAWL
jgi:hypothetical protein